MPSTRTMASVIGRVSANAPAPASTSTRMISSLAYAEDEILSEANTESPVKTLTRSCGSSALASRRPTRSRQTLSQRSAHAVLPDTKIAARHQVSRCHAPKVASALDPQISIAGMETVDDFDLARVAVGRQHRVALVEMRLRVRLRNAARVVSGPVPDSLNCSLIPSIRAPRPHARASPSGSIAGRSESVKVARPRIQKVLEPTRRRVTRCALARLLDGRSTSERCSRWWPPSR